MASSADPLAGPPRSGRTGAFVRGLWGFIMFLMVAGALGAAAYLYRELQRERAARDELAKRVAEIDPKFEAFKAAVREVDKSLSATVFQQVDLGAGGWQPIAGGFYVIDLNVAPQGDGVKLTGKVINPTSVTHDAAQFSARIGGRRGTFGLAHLPPGVAQPFDVLIAGVAPAEARHVYLAIESSTISFASSTTRKKSAAEPVDTDKVLK